LPAVPTALDTALLRELRTRCHQRALERAILAFSALGEHGAVWYALSAGAALVDPPRRGVYLRAALSVAGAYGANQLIKPAVGRRRPRLPDLPPLKATQLQLSYPSAHASTAFAAARALSRAWPPLPLYAAATAMAVSRPYIGVHYPSDVVAGAVLGTAVAELVG
jgi:undecaprenyl-diphosphatase